MLKILDEEEHGGAKKDGTKESGKSEEGGGSGEQ